MTQATLTESRASDDRPKSLHELRLEQDAAKLIDLMSNIAGVELEADEALEVVRALWRPAR